MRKKIYFTLFLFLVLLTTSSVAHAADIFTVTSQSNVSQNQTFTVSIYTDTKGVSINNIEATLSFPPELLSVNSVSTSGSIFSLWVQQPSFSNTAGTVYFNGGVPNPGYTGSKGKVISIEFTAKKAGSAPVFFSTADIYANDGQGTDVVSGKSGTTVNITSPVPVVPVAPVNPVVLQTPAKTGVVDITPPENLNVVSSTTEDDIIALFITSEDSGGISKYKITIDGVSVFDVVPKNNEANVFLPPQLGGNHQIAVTAYDQAGNKTDKILTVEFPKIKSPIITKYPESITSGQKIQIQGTSYINTDVRIWIKTEKEDAQSYVVKTASDSTFSFTSNPMDSTGLVYFWAETVRATNVVSAPSDKYFVSVNQSAFVKVSRQTIEILALTIPALLFLIFLIYLGLHSYYRLKKMRRRLMPDLVQTETEAHKIFKILTEDSRQILKVFKKDSKVKLTSEHTEALDTLSKDIEEAEEYFTKRIKDIERKDL